jgi:hypothetical protein
MPNIKYTYIPLDKATIVDRRHQREVQPPGMVNLENFLPARSDASPTLRPDWLYTEDQVYGISSVLTLPDTSTLRDALNAANGLYGSDQVTFFTTFVPYGNDNGTLRILSGTYGDGRISGSSGSSLIGGVSTLFLEKAYRGAIIRVAAGATGTFSGAPFLATESTNTGEWYITELDETEYSLDWTELYSAVAQYGQGASIEYKIGTPGSFTGINKLGVGDEDTLGFSAFYIRGSSSSDPDILVSDAKQLITIETATNISGSNYKWTASGSGTNEYYYVTRADGDPILTSGVVSLYTGTVYGETEYESGGENVAFFPNTDGTTLKDWNVEGETTALTAGTVGSLANLEFALDDNETPALGFNTIYIRDDTGDPDTRASARARGVASIGLAFDASSFSTCRWDYTSDATAGSRVSYVRTVSRGNPFINTKPNLVTYKDSGREYIMEEASDIEGSTGKYWYYGDKDSLGYNTVYMRSTKGSPYYEGATIYFNRALYGSNYSWIASAGGTNEYYLAQQDGATELAADFTEPVDLYFDQAYAEREDDGKWVLGGSEDSDYLGRESVPSDETFVYSESSRVKSIIGSLGDKQWGYGTNALDGLTNDTIYIRWDAGDPDTVALKVRAVHSHALYVSEYKWVESPATSDEWYFTKTDESDPAISEPETVIVGGVAYTEGTVGSLASGEFDYGNNDTLGYNTIYIYSTTDPNGSVGTGLGDEEAPKSISSESAEDDFDYYVVNRVVENDSLEIYGELETSFSGTIPQFYYNHNPFNADYKLNIQAYTSGLIYCAPSIRDNLNEEDISGPFYADLQKGDWRYGGEITVDYNFDGTGVLFEKQPSLATNLTSFIQIFPTVDDAGDTDLPQSWFLGYSSGLGANNAWSKKYFPSNSEGQAAQVTVTGDGTTMRLNSIQATGSMYMSAAQVISSTACYPGIAYSTTGLSWTLASITGDIDGNATAWSDTTGATRTTSDYQAICAATSTFDLGRIVCLVWREIAGGELAQLYSDDSGATWTHVATTTTLNQHSKIRYLNGQFILVSEGFIGYGDGSSNTIVSPDAGDSDTANFRDIAFDGDERWVVISDNFNAWYADGLDGTWTKVAMPLDFYSLGDSTNFIHWDSIGERFVINSQRAVFWSADGETWSSEYIGSFGEQGSVKLPTNIMEDYSGLIFTLYDGGADYVRNAILSRYNYYYWDVVDFVPLSDIYRSITFSVLDGYVVLLGTTEYDEDEGWVYNPRRIRWTAPATYNDFSSTGSGTADANGEGAFMDSRPVNGRIVAFETNRISAIVPRGDVNDPWDYDVVKEDFRILSNPVAVDDLCYVIATDGLLYATDGIEVSEVGSSFDATKFDDFTENKPIRLEYSRAFNALIAYYFDASATSHYAYFISTGDGVVTKVEIPTLGSSGTLAYAPRFVTAVSDSSDQRVIASHHPLSTDTDLVVTTTLGTNSQISGVDRPQYGSSTNNTYWYATLETGELYLAPEGNKTSLKHIIVRTYSDAPGDNTDRPRIIAQIKSLEDDEWHTCGDVDVYSTFDIDDDECTTTGEGEAAFTNLMASGSGAGGSTVTVIPPFDPTGCRYYKKTGTTYTLQTSGTDYTATSASAVFTDNGPPAGTDLYAYWENYPEIRISTGDFVESTQSLHRVTGTTGTNATGGLTLDHYLTSGSSSEETSTHYPAEQLGDGEAEVKIGVNKLVEGFKLRLLVVPHYGATAAPTIVKITGIVFGHVPQGRKILQATGS